jgi:hypothetical protein
VASHVTIDGVYAECALVSADRLVPILLGIDMRMAAAALVQGTTPTINDLTLCCDHRAVSAHRDPALLASG